MLNDDVYRFVVLRQVAARRPGPLTDPFIEAYERAADAKDSFQRQVTDALAGGDVTAAAELSSALIAKTGQDAWRLVPDGLVDAFDALGGYVERDGRAAALTALRARYPGDDGREVADLLAADLARAREALADHLSAVTILGGDTGDLDGAAQLIRCAETARRLLSDDEDVGRAWQIPVLSGRVVLPYELPDPSAEAPDDPRDALADLGARERRPARRPMWPPHFIGDLIVLKQQLRNYELGEIAHVENVLGHEHVDRTFRTLRRTESRLLTSEETEKEVIRDLQSTTRDELSTEIDSLVSEQLDLSANFNVTATYLGPSVTVTGNVGGSAGYRRSTEERTSTATAHSQEVVAKASVRIRERTLTQREVIETSETEDTATHGFTNESADPIVGVYRWLEKVFDLHLVNYGRRLIYEFVVPEPASYWSSLVDRRGTGLAGPKPGPPRLGAAVLAVTDFSLTAADGTPLDQPPRWPEIVTLAGEWGVTLTEPPVTARQVHFVLQDSGPESGNDPEKAITRFGANDNDYFYESGVVATQTGTQPLSVPDGYAARDGEAALKGWMYVRKGPRTHQFERGYANLLLNGAIYTFSHGVDANDTGGIAKIGLVAAGLIPAGGTIQGDVQAILTTTLNGLSCSIRLDCVRTAARARQWADATYVLFAAAYAERLARWEDERTRATVGNEGWAGALPSQTARGIERRELKRGILTQLTGSALAALGGLVLSDGDATEPAPSMPALNQASLPIYAQIVRFFEEVFDWTNLAYVLSPYFYGRRSQWTSLALAENTDAQFTAFLSAGSARVQVPVRLGYEAHACHFFRPTGRLPSLEARIPWVGSMRAIALDLAADAREGFQPGTGQVSVEPKRDVVRGTGTRFGRDQDTDREIRLRGKVYVVREVRSATEIRIAPAYQGTALDNSWYELGGLVVGAAFPLRLPTTLIAIDTPDLRLPTYPGRYAE